MEDSLCWISLCFLYILLCIPLLTEMAFRFERTSWYILKSVEIIIILCSEVAELASIFFSFCPRNSRVTQGSFLYCCVLKLTSLRAGKTSNHKLLIISGFPRGFLLNWTRAANQWLNGCLLVTVNYLPANLMAVVGKGAFALSSQTSCSHPSLLWSPSVWALVIQNCCSQICGVCSVLAGSGNIRLLFMNRASQWSGYYRVAALPHTQLACKRKAE